MKTVEVKEYKNIFVAVVAVLVMGIVIPFYSFNAHFRTKCKKNNLALSQGIASDKDGLYCNRILYMSETFPSLDTKYKIANLYIDVGVSKAFLGNERGASGLFNKALKAHNFHTYNDLDSLNKQQMKTLANLDARAKRFRKNTKQHQIWLDVLAQQFNETIIDPK